MKIIFITGHDAEAPRKVGFHFWAESLANKGVDVDFITVGLSGITYLKKSHRLFTPPLNRWVNLSSHIRKFIWCPLFHPFSLNNPVLDAITTPFFRLYPAMLPESLKVSVRQADTIVVESGVGLVLMKKLVTLAPNAKFIYNCSDKLSALTFHPLVQKSECDAIPLFHKIRVPAAVMKTDFPVSAPTTYIAQGIDKKAFDTSEPNPFTTKKNAVSVGDMLFSQKVIRVLAEKFPDWTFHLFGKNAVVKNKMKNIVEHGEQPFSHIAPFMTHADIGIAPYKPAPNADYLSQSSLKMMQYTYCKLPIVAPAFAATGRDHVISFNQDANVESLTSAFERAMHYDRETIDTSQVLSWDQVTNQIFEINTK